MSEEIFCPNCESTQIVTNDKGFGLVKAAAGGYLFGPVGLLGGVIGSKKIKLNCLICGHTWILTKNMAAELKKKKGLGPIDKVPVYKNSSNDISHKSNRQNPSSLISEKTIEEQSKKHTLIIGNDEEKELSPTKEKPNNIGKNHNIEVEYLQNFSGNYFQNNAPPKVMGIEPKTMSIEDRLAKLNSLKENNLISENDYLKKKEEILSEL